MRFIQGLLAVDLSLVIELETVSVPTSEACFHMLFDLESVNTACDWDDIATSSRKTIKSRLIAHHV